MKILRMALVSVALLQTSFLASAEAQCDCDHFPWTPDSCVDVCGALVLRQATEAELKTFLNLEPTTARSIVEMQARATQLQSLKQVGSALSQQEYKKILESLLKLEPLEAQYHVQSPEQRRSFLEKIKSAPPR